LHRPAFALTAYNQGCANTGMRKGDLLNLTWQQVDFERGVIFMPNKKAGDGRGHFLPMNSIVRGELVTLHSQRMNDRVFEVGDVKKAFATACRLAGILNLRFHDLRHAAATRLAEAGADAFTIAAILGHSTIQMSARYTHIADERKRQALEAIAKAGTQSGHNKKEAPVFDASKSLSLKVSRVGLEPTTRWLKARAEFYGRLRLNCNWLKLLQHKATDQCRDYC
jgi:hypothetical protein